MSLWLPRRSTVPERPSAGGEFDLLAAALHACWHTPPGGLEAGACAGAGLSRMTGTGFGVGRPTRGSAFWASGTGGAFAALPLGAGTMALHTEIGVPVPLGRPRFFLEGIGTVHRPSALALRAGLGIELRFW